MSKFFTCTTIFGRLASCRHRQQPPPPPPPPPRAPPPESGAGADAASASPLSGWRTWLAYGAAAASLTVPALSDLWPNQPGGRRPVVARRSQWSELLGVTTWPSTTLCVLDGPLEKRQQPLKQQQPLEEVAKSLTARSVEQACRLCTSRAVAEARAGRPDRARSLWLAAANFSYPPALFNLGLLAAGSGLGDEAAAYYRAAADLGHPAAAFNLSVMLMQQEDEEEEKTEQLRLAPVSQRHPRESRRWLSRAANSGLAEALLLEAERFLVDEGRPGAAERRLLRLLASGEASPATVAAAEGLLRRCREGASNVGFGGGGDPVGLKRCSRSAPNFASLTTSAGCEQLHHHQPCSGCALQLREI